MDEQRHNTRPNGQGKHNQKEQPKQPKLFSLEWKTEEKKQKTRNIQVGGLLVSWLHRLWRKQ